MDKAAEKRVRRAVECARAAVTRVEFSDLYRRRFHAAMDALQSEEEGREVYERCKKEPWYERSSARRKLRFE